jgi:NADH-quinone oxidoreductase subunit C
MLTNERILEKLKSQFNDVVKNPDLQFGLLAVSTDSSFIIPVMKFLKEDEELNFNFLTTLCGVHWPDREMKFEVVYHLHSFRNNIRLRVKAPIAGENPKIASMTALWSAANWMERETYDFFGIIFEGHPNLKRIFNVDEMKIFPMRKEYPLEDNTRTDKNDEMFGRDPKLIRPEMN